MGGWKIHIVSHTHWDREWYLPYQVFRAKLVEMIDSLLNILERKKNFRYFTLDGQTVVLEDYLELRPERLEELRKWIGAGRVFIGPWYTLPDEFLVSGESLIRNLLMGERIAERFGHVMKVGYLPDPFGHIQEIPQILQGFDIDNIVFWRGYSVDEEHKSEFIWVAKDGSQVIAINLPDGYFNAFHITKKGFEEFKRMVEGKFSRLARYATTQNVLLMNGEDHLFPEELLGDYIEMAKDPRLMHSNLEIFVKEIRKNRANLKKLSGELRDCRRSPILSGVLSSRMYLKIRNHRYEALLEKYVEPLSVIAYLQGMLYPAHLIRQAWKYLLQNQTHDGICGTSVDEVHREMLTRYAWIEEISDYVIKKAIAFIFGEEKGNKREYMVFNPLNWEVKERIEIPVSGNLKLHPLTEKDDEIPSDVVDGHLIFVDSFPPLGYRVYRLEEEKNSSNVPPSEAGEGSIENEYLKITVKGNGSVDMEDKRTGKRYKGLNLLVDEGDAGDEYNFSPPEEDYVVTSSAQRAKIRILRGNVISRIYVDFDLPLPESLTADRKRRKRRRIRCPVKIVYSLYRGIPRLDVKVTIINKAKDHRLRVLFPTGIKVEKVVAASHFGVIDRKVDVERWDDSWIEVPQPTKPHKGWIDLSDGSSGFMIATKGLPEYEATGDGNLYITLLRSVGWLSRSDLRTRKIRAGPEIETPEAQCIGRHEFEYSLIPHKGNWENAYALANQFIYSPQAFPIASEKNIPKEFSLLSLNPPLILSALKKSEKDENIIVRFYNPTDREITGEMVLSFPIANVSVVNLREREVQDPGIRILSKERERIKLVVKPYKIVTLKLTPKN